MNRERTRKRKRKRKRSRLAAGQDMQDAQDRIKKKIFLFYHANQAHPFPSWFPWCIQEPLRSQEINDQTMER